MLSNEEVSQIVETIWAATVDLTAERVPSVELGVSQERMTGCVHITGGWNGALTLDCSATLAREASARLFDTDPCETTSEDVYDTLSEITNMTGGNLKALLSKGTDEALQLSLPSITEGRNYKVALPRTHEVFQAFYEIEGEPLVVTLLERNPEA